MAEMPTIDPDFEPQSRPRSCTWPMNRPNICSRGNDNQDGDIAMKLEATIEECGSQEQLMADTTDISGMVKQEPKQELYSTMSPGAFSSAADYSSVLIGSPSTNLVSNILQTPLNITKTEPNFTASENMSQLPPFASAHQSSQGAGNDGNKGVTLDVGSVANTESPPVSTASVVTKAKTSSRKNAWGNMSYADLITQGIESSPDKRLTLAQIYDWMVKNVPYFKDKGDSNSSAGWKNSIRHNLSLHSKFKRIQNEGTGKSSWWVINYDAKPGKPARRRTTSMDTQTARGIKQRTKAAKQKADQLKKEKAMKHEAPNWTKSPNADRSQDFEIPAKSFASEFRNRTSSNASSIGGRSSPQHTGLLQDLEADGPPPLSPLSSSLNPESSFTELFGHGPDAFSLVNSIDADPHSDILDSFAGIDMLSPSSPMPQCQSSVMTAANNDRTNIYLNTPSNNANSQANSTSAINKTVLSSPNLASLLQQGTTTTSIKSMTLNSMPLKQNVDLGGPVQRVRANTMPRLRPQPKYNMSDSMQKPLQQSAESLSQETLLTPFKAPETTLSASPHNVYMNSMQGSYQQYPQTQASEINIRGNETQPRVPSSASETTSLYQLLGSQANTGIKSQQHLQHNGLNIQQSPQQPANIPNQIQQQQQHQQQQQQQVMMDNHNLPMQDFPQFTKQNAMLGIGRPDPSQQQQHIDDSNLMQMSQRKFPSDINIDNHEFFDPGSSLELDQMLQEMDVPNEFAMDFGYPFQQDSVSGIISGMDLDSTMETNAACNTNKHNDSSEQAYQYNTGQLGLGTMSTLQQGQYQQQAQHQAPPPQYNAQQHPMFQDMNPYCGNGPNVLIDSRANGVVMGAGGNTGSPAMGGNAFAQQFTQPHPNLRQQSSVGSIGHYHM